MTIKAWQEFQKKVEQNIKKGMTPPKAYETAKIEWVRIR